MKKIKFHFIFAMLLFSISVSATVKPNPLFGDHMVLQQNVDVPVWGTAADGERITVTFGQQRVSTIAKDGKWMLILQPLKAGGPFEMTIQGENEFHIGDILVGEVWLCSGQSNMERELGPRPPQKPILNWEQQVAQANFPQIREFSVPHVAAPSPLSEIDSKWIVCSPQTVKNFSAVGYFFAKALHQNLKVPIGILFSAWGGTPAENWTSKAALSANPELLSAVQNYDKALASYPDKLRQYQQNEPQLLQKWQADTLIARKEGKKLPAKPLPPANPAKSGAMGGMYNAMIVPLQPYAIKGVCWYQGESNNGKAKQYQKLLSSMIADWRKAWAKDFPFLIVQIAPYKDMNPEIREAQFLTWKKTPSTALIVTTDCGDANDIHPANKEPIGKRLALAASALAYQQKLVYSGPVYKEVKFKKNEARLSFDYTGTGLVAGSGALTGFTIVGADGVFLPAKAEIKGRNIIVSHDLILNPTAVRYGWSNVPVVNLYNKEGLPASPFRTDAPK